MKKVKYDLWPEDIALFDKMEKEAITDKEREFFEKVRYKQEYVLTYANDLLLWEGNNEDHLYLVRCRTSEYDFGHGTEGHFDEEIHTMNLANVLSVNLRDAGYLDRDITLFDWLRERDYAGIEYDHNYDDL